MKYMLDTNVCIDYMRGTDIGVIEHILKSGNNELCISSITLSELLFGVNKSSNPQRNRGVLYSLLTKIEILDYGSKASECYGLLRNELSGNGCVIGSLDMLIAAHAMSEDLILVTHNSSEFGRVKGLKIEDWHI